MRRDHSAARYVRSARALPLSSMQSVRHAHRTFHTCPLPLDGTPRRASTVVARLKCFFRNCGKAHHLFLPDADLSLSLCGVLRCFFRALFCCSFIHSFVRCFVRSDSI